MNAITVSQAKENLEQLIAHVIGDAEPMIVVTDAGERIVLLPLDEYNLWRETLYLLSSPANAAHLWQSVAEAQAGTVVERELMEA